MKTAFILNFTEFEVQPTNHVFFSFPDLEEHIKKIYKDDNIYWLQTGPFTITFYQKFEDDVSIIAKVYNNVIVYEENAENN